MFLKSNVHDHTMKHVLTEVYDVFYIYTNNSIPKLCRKYHIMQQKSAPTPRAEEKPPIIIMYLIHWFITMYTMLISYGRRKG